MTPETNAAKIANAIMQYIREETKASGVRIGHYPVDFEDIERVVAERTGARKEVIRAVIEALIAGKNLVRRTASMVSLK